MAEGERATGTPNTIYNLSSVLFHALEGAASYDTYIEDAEREGDQELTEFFRRVREEDNDRAKEAQLLIAEKTSTAGRRESPVTSISERATSGASPVAEEVLPGDARRETSITRTPEQDLVLPGEEEPPDISRPGEVQPGRTEEAPSPRPEPSDDFPGTEPLREDVSRARTGEVPPPEEVPPERAGEIPTAEEVPPPRTEEVPLAEEVPSGTPPQAPPGNVQRGTSPEASSRTGEAPGVEEDRARPEKREEDKGLIERTKDYLLGEGRERDYLRGEDRER